jgi:hypothetical protein
MVRNGEAAAPLRRLELGGQAIKEDFLQNLLDRNPSILPVSKFSESFGPLVSLGREIMGIDNLFVSPTGRLTVVETKLWRNPQATREVLAQILDYANRLSSLDVEGLEQRCISANQSALSESRCLFELVRQSFPDQTPNESEFNDRLQKSLSTGRFLLLVVGDGIREGLEGVLDSLHHQSRLHFTFGLVEMKLYRTPPDDALLVVPSVVAHSTEIERAIVTIRGAQPDQVEVSVRSDPGEKAPRLTESEFLESIQDAEVRQFGERLFDWGRQRGWIEITKNGASASIRIPFTATRAGFILLRLFKSGKVYTTPPRLRRVLRRIGIGEQEVVRLARELQQLVPEIQIDEQSEMVARSIPARLLSVHLDEVLEVYDAAIQRFKALDPGVENPEDEIETDEDS